MIVIFNTRLRVLIREEYCKIVAINKMADKECHPSNVGIYFKRVLEGCVVVKILGWTLASFVNLGED